MLSRSSSGFPPGKRYGTIASSLVLHYGVEERDDNIEGRGIPAWESRSIERAPGDAAQKRTKRIGLLSRWRLARK
jgi:hypothetical protein